jgi:hypothetical protein
LRDAVKAGGIARVEKTRPKYSTFLIAGDVPEFVERMS